MDYLLKKNQEGTYISERFTRIILERLIKNQGYNYVDLRSPCGAATGQLLYNYDGDIYTCDEARMLGNDLFRLGNINTDSFEQMFDTKKMAPIISVCMNENLLCNYCVYKPYCGICPVCNYAEQGNVITNITLTNRCKILKAQFHYIFENIILKEKALASILKVVR